MKDICKVVQIGRDMSVTEQILVYAYGVRG